MPAPPAPTPAPASPPPALAASSRSPNTARALGKWRNNALHARRVCTAAGCVCWVREVQLPSSLSLCHDVTPLPRLCHKAYSERASSTWCRCGRTHVQAAQASTRPQPLPATASMPRAPCAHRPTSQSLAQARGEPTRHAPPRPACAASRAWPGCFPWGPAAAGHACVLGCLHAVPRSVFTASPTHMLECPPPAGNSCPHTSPHPPSHSSAPHLGQRAALQSLRDAGGRCTQVGQEHGDGGQGSLPLTISCTCCAAHPRPMKGWKK